MHSPTLEIQPPPGGPTAVGEGFSVAVEKARAGFKTNQQNQLETAGELAVSVGFKRTPSIITRSESHDSPAKIGPPFTDETPFTPLRLCSAKMNFTQKRN